MEQEEQERYEREMEMEQRRMSVGQGGEVASDVQASMLRDQDKNMIREQLNLGEELENIEHLLKGHVLRIKDGVQEWDTNPDTEMVILSEHGVHLIMNSICFYLNKNTLLSNYDEDTINSKMEDFATSLTDALFMKYEKYFYYPTFEDCKKVLKNRIDRKTELRKYALELIGSVADNEIIKKQVIKEIEERIEHEMETIREQLIKDKLKNFDLIMRQVQDCVHSAYLRALFGAERRTLREHIHISENLGYRPPTGKNKQQSSYNPVSWMRRG